MADRRILMCPPDHYAIEYEINPWMDRNVGTVHEVAVRQWGDLRSILIDLGATVDLMEPRPGLPDLVFTANAGLVLGRSFLVSRFRHGVRQGESVHYAAWASAAGFDVVAMPDGHNFEGAGDALFCGETLFAGYRFRSDAKSHHWIGERFGVEILPVELVDPRFYHLDTCFCPLDERSALYYPGAFDDYGRSVLAGRIDRLIEVSPEEAATFTCNAVVVGRSVVLNADSPKLARSLADAGFRVRPTALTEFIKAGGSAKCLTLRIDGEEAAAWRRRAETPAT